MNISFEYMISCTLTFKVFFLLSWGRTRWIDPCLKDDKSSGLSFSDRNFFVVVVNFDILSSSPEPISTELETKHPWVKGNQIC